MTVLIVGADRIKAFEPKLRQWGASHILHWSARNTRCSKCVIPQKTDLVICCTDFLNHNMAKKVKQQIKERCLPAVYCRRAWCDMEKELNKLRAEDAAGDDACCWADKCRQCACRKAAN